jgi:hypothetical protein
MFVFCRSGDAFKSKVVQEKIGFLSAFENDISWYACVEEDGETTTSSDFTVCDE